MITLTRADAFFSDASSMSGKTFGRHVQDTTLNAYVLILSHLVAFVAARDARQTSLNRPIACPDHLAASAESLLEIVDEGLAPILPDAALKSRPRPRSQLRSRSSALVDLQNVYGDGDDNETDDDSSDSESFDEETTREGQHEAQSQNSIRPELVQAGYDFFVNVLTMAQHKQPSSPSLDLMSSFVLCYGCHTSSRHGDQLNLPTGDHITRPISAVFYVTRMLVCALTLKTMCERNVGTTR